jgi:hypothetical protein
VAQYIEALRALTNESLGDLAPAYFGFVPPEVEYRLTREGDSLTPVIASIRQWGEPCPVADIRYI